jgi:hypothetical protein
LATTDLPFGVVSAPGQRYHPAILAQALGTLAAMYPERIWAALGSGEAANERITGDAWPRKEIRDDRLEECVDVIRRLLAGEEVSHDGLVKVNRAQLWSLPDRSSGRYVRMLRGRWRCPVRLIGRPAIGSLVHPCVPLVERPVPSADAQPGRCCSLSGRRREEL